jgi:hypothetical protein
VPIIFVKDSKQMVDFLMNFNFIYTFLLIFFSHTYQFIKFYILNRKFKETSAQNLFFQPYGRVFLQQLLILGGVWFIEKKGLSPNTVVLIILVGLKTFIDIVGVLIYIGNSKKVKSIANVSPVS